MQRIGEITTRAIGDRSAAAPDSSLAESAIRRLHGLFGNAFADKYRTNQFVELDVGGGKTQNFDRGALAARREWTRGLAGYTAAEVHRAIEMIEQSGRREPPSLPEFKAVLRTCREETSAPRLENPDLPTQQEGREKLAEIRDKYLAGAMERSGDNAINRLMDVCYAAFRDARNEAEGFPDAWKGVSSA